jgi:uncharacterized iron-regulated protein
VVTARIEIGRLQRRLWQRQRRLIADSVQGSNAAFHAYEARYLRRTRRFQREASYAELLSSIDAADLTFVGDYHTLKQSQRSFLKLLRQGRSPRQAVLALEFVQGRHQAALDEYLSGRIGEARFLERIEYRRHAVFDTWPNFRPILEEARQQRLPVVAIDLLGDAKTTLAERDGYAARRIARALKARPDARLLTLAGQLHVAPQHLPAAVEDALGSVKRTSLTVYQNCEAIWWALQRDGRELEVEACVVRPGEFCLINTPPVVVQQSFLDWVDGGFLENPEVRFKGLARIVARFLRLDDAAFRAECEQVSVYTAGDLSFLGTLPGRGFSRLEIAQIERQILSRESYYIPRARIAYLANLSVNHAAEEATHFLRNVVSGAGDEPRGLIDAFYARALEEAYAFCGSKIVNPRRKCPHAPEFERLARGPDRFLCDVARFVLDHLRIERGELGRASLHKLYSRGPDLFNAVTHSLGYMLGEKLYYALATGRLLKPEVRQLFLDPLSDEGDAMLTYLDLAKRLRNVRIPRRV